MSNRSRIDLFILVAAVFAQIFGGLWHGAPAHPEINFSGKKVIGSFSVFVFWSLALWGWGRLLSRAVGWERVWHLSSILLGTAALAWLAMVFGHLGLIGPFRVNQQILRLTLMGGLVANAYFASRTRRSPRKPAPLVGGEYPVLAFVLALLIAVVLLSTLLGAFVPVDITGDAMRYHLVGPKLWSDAARIYLPPHVPLVFQCAYWEYLYLWGFSFLSLPGPRGLIEGHLFGQWTHAFWGYGGTAVVLFLLFRNFARRRVWLMLALLAALSIPALSYTAWSARNDWGVILWITGAGTLLFGRHCRRPLHFGIAGALLGMGVASKTTAVFAAVALVATWVLLNRNESGLRSKVFSLAMGALIAITPILLRNALATGNPVYPALNALFQSDWLGPTWAEHQLAYEGSGLDLDWRSWLSKWRSLLNEVPFALLLLLLWPVWFFRKADTRRMLPLGVIGVSGFLLFASKIRSGPGDFLHLAGPILPLLTGAGVLLAEKVFERLYRPAAALIAVLVSVYVLSTATLPLRVWLDIFDLPTPTVAIRGMMIGGYAKAWLRNNARQGEMIFTTGDNQIYYISHLNFAVIPESPEIDRRTVFVHDPVKLLRVLRANGGRYLLDSKHWHPLRTSRVARRLARLTFAHPEAIVVATRSSDVYDLARLEQEVFSGCINPYAKRL